MNIITHDIIDVAAYRKDVDGGQETRNQKGLALSPGPLIKSMIAAYPQSNSRPSCY